MARKIISGKIRERVAKLLGISLEKFNSKTKTEMIDYRDAFILAEYYRGATPDNLARSWNLTRQSIYNIINKHKKN